MVRRSCGVVLGRRATPVATLGRQYLVRVGVTGAQQPLVLVEQHPELTVELGLVEQLAQHGAARSHLPALGLSETQKEREKKKKCIKT